MTAALVGSKPMGAVLQVSPDTVRRLAESGEIPAVRVGRFWRFDPDEVIAHLKQRRVQADPWARTPAARRALNRRRVA